MFSTGRGSPLAFSKVSPTVICSLPVIEGAAEGQVPGVEPGPAAPGARSGAVPGPGVGDADADRDVALRGGDGRATRVVGARGQRQG